MVKDLALLDSSVPHVDQAQPVQFEIVLQSADGRELARNSLDLLVLPARARLSFQGPMAVITRDGQSGEAGPAQPKAAGLEQSLRLVGYRARLTPDTRVAGASQPDADLLGWVRAGGDLQVMPTHTILVCWSRIREPSYIKLLKRSMYGRASFELLRRRVLLVVVPGVR